MLASVGSFNNKQWMWFRDVRLESGPTHQHTSEGLKPYRSCPGRAYDWPEPAPGDKKRTGCRYWPFNQFLAQASTGNTKSDVRRAKSDENEQKRRCQAKIFFNSQVKKFNITLGKVLYAYSFFLNTYRDHSTLQ